jgi:signal transduction histidine kinase
VIRAHADFSKSYAVALETYLSASDEAQLQTAHHLGRRALGEGIGVLDLAALHHEALDALAHGTVAERRTGLEKAAEFFVESLSPFEMALRGFREANGSLQSANEDLREAKASADAANRELESFSYAVAHDLRAPLRSLAGFTQALFDDNAGKLGEDSQRHLHYLQESVQSMTALIDGLLDLARISRGELRKEAVDLTATARGVIQRLRASQPERQVEVVIEPDAPAYGDARLLQIVLENLLGNAWKFTGKRERARIEFGSSTGDGRRVYFVSDNGAGFDMAYEAKLFDVFQRLHTTDDFEGTGIGLATVKRIVERHGGQVWAEGTVGGGATFTFTLASALGAPG